MEVQLVYLARLREAFGSSGERAVLPEGVATVGALVEWLRARGGEWASQLAPGRAWRVAVNQSMAAADAAIAAGDEIAFFPPVTGG